MQIWAIGTTRNEADIVRLNVSYHLAQGIDRFLVIDDGSTDGTLEVLEGLSATHPVEVRSNARDFRQRDLLTDLARECFIRGADWVVPIDADEFWHAPGATVRGVLETSPAGALAVRVVNFVQERGRVERHADTLLSMTHRATAVDGPIERAAALVDRGEIAFVEIPYPPKWASRTAAALEIGWGSHTLSGAPQPWCETDALVCLHAPLRARAVLRAKADAGRPLEDVEEYLAVAWHVRRWRRLAEEERLGDEWRANSHEAGRLDVYGRSRVVVPDTRLVDVTAPFLSSACGGSRSQASADRRAVWRSPAPAPRVWGLLMVRNEVDVVRASVLHHLSIGLEHISVVDNGSSDGTDEVLEELACDSRVEWRRAPGLFRQAETVTALARDAFRRGATWVLPFDADEFWSPGDGCTLNDVLRATDAGAVACRVVNFVQARDVVDASPEALSRIVMRVADPVGTIGEAEALVEARRIGFVQAAYARKWISRATPDLRIEQGNHAVTGAGSFATTEDIVCLHAPLRSRAVLEAQVEHGRRLDALGLAPSLGWHVRRWRRIASSGTLENEWRANSHVDGLLDVYGAAHALVEDHRLRDVARPWIDPGAVPPPAPARPTRHPAMVPGAPALALVERTPGWLERAEAELLMKTSARATVEHPHAALVEIGSYLGRSTMALASVLRESGSPGPLYAVDPHEGLVGAADSSVGLRVEAPTYEAFQANVDRAGLGHLVVPVRAQSSDVDWRLPIGLLFVDGLHDRSSVAADVEHFAPWIVEGGFLVFHDYSPLFPGVVATVDRLSGSGRYDVVSQAGTLIVLGRRPEPILVEPMSDRPGQRAAPTDDTAAAYLAEDELARVWGRMADLERELRLRASEGDASAALVRTLTAEAGRRDEVIQSLNRAVVEYRALAERLPSVEARLADAAAQRDALEEEVARVRAYVRSLEALPDVLRQREADVQAFRTSWSWRLTAPLRWLYRVVSRRRGGYDGSGWRAP